MVDIRPLSLPMDTIHFRAGSILEMPFENASVASLSSICVIEHIGLGRYGDPPDPRGTQKALDELKRILAPGGNLYLDPWMTRTAPVSTPTVHLRKNT